MAVSLVDAFSQLVSDFGGQAEDLRDAAALRGAFAAGSSQLVRAEADVAQLEFNLDALEQQIAEDEAAVRRAKEMTVEARQHSARLRHMMDELPPSFAPLARVSQRPRRAMEPLPHVIDPLTAAERVALGERKPASSSPRVQVPKLALVTAEELSGAPKYMKGRLSLEAVNAALGDIQAIAQAKYRLLQTARSKQSQRFRQLQEQETPELRGTVFVLDSDLRGSSVKASDASGKALLQTLRHLGRLRLVTEGGVQAFVLQGSAIP